MATELKTQITEAVKDAMRAKAKDKLGVLRMVTAEIKRIEVDERIDVQDDRILAILDKMVKQRRDSAKQFADNDRQELADKENFEIEVIQTFLPKQLNEAEVQAVISETASAIGASGMPDLGKLMGALKPKLQGRADMGQASKLAKAHLQG